MTKPTRIPSVPELRRHAHELARAFEVLLVEDKDCAPDEACALPRHRIVRVAPITDETLYAVALHELGHLIAPAGFVRSSTTSSSLALRQHEEDCAWEWAEYHALLWTAPMQHVATWARGTYDATPTATVPKVAPRKINWDEWK